MKYKIKRLTALLLVLTMMMSLVFSAHAENGEFIDPENDGQADTLETTDVGDDEADDETAAEADLEYCIEDGENEEFIDPENDGQADTLETTAEGSDEDDNETAAETDFEYYIEDGEAVISKYVGDVDAWGTVYIPATLGGYPVAVVGENSFYYYGLELLSCKPFSCVIPDGVRAIGDWAFYWCGLTDIEIPDSVESIGGNAFAWCERLTTIHISENVTYIGPSAFWGSALTDIYYDGSESEWKELTSNNGGRGDKVTVHYGKGTGEPSHTMRYNLSDTYSFKNYGGSISKSYFNKLFGKAMAKELYQRGFGKGGHCLGMVYTAIASTVYDSPSATTYYNFWDKYAESLFDVKKNWKSWSTGISASDYINYGHLYQRTEDFLEENKANANNLDGLYAAIVDNLLFDGAPVQITIYGTISTSNGGHALWALGIGENTDDVTELIIYDCNHPNEERSLYLYKDNGEYTSWEYELWDGLVWGTGRDNAKISFTTGADIFIGLYNSNLGYIPSGYSKALFSSNRSTSVKTADGAEICLSPVTVENSDLLLYIETVDVIMDSEQEYPKDDAYWANIGDTITLSVPEEASSYSFVAPDSGIDVALPANSEATLSLYEDDYNSALLTMPENETFELAYFDVVDSDDTLETITFSGDSAETVTSQQTADGIVIASDNLNGMTVSLTIEDDDVDLITIETTCSSVLVTNEDNELVVYEDQDDDGIYETRIPEDTEPDDPSQDDPIEPDEPGQNDPGDGDNTQKPDDGASATSPSGGSSNNNSTTSPETGAGTSTTGVKTGDDANLLLWTAALLISASVLVATILIRKKRKSTK